MIFRFDSDLHCSHSDLIIVNVSLLALLAFVSSLQSALDFSHVLFSPDCVCLNEFVLFCLFVFKRAVCVR